MDSYDVIKDYYGQVLKSKADLQTNACCPAEAVPSDLKPVLSKIHPEILEKFYGCGVPLPSALEGCTVLDLGCGTGRDAYVLSKLVGEAGRVIGIDMTDEQLAVAERHYDYHAEAFGYQRSNVEFRKGLIEDLQACDIADASIDVVVSNCVFNLSPDKDRVFSEVFRVLKPGGELYFSDVFVDRRLSLAVQNNPVLRGECLGGAMYAEDFRRIMQRVGCADERTVSATTLTVENPKLAAQLGTANFYSMTKRAFKVSLEDRCEDYGQVAYYRGTVAGATTRFVLDDHHVFETGKPMLVCQNTANMLLGTRFAAHFTVTGDTEVHYGLFDCSTPAPSGSALQGSAAGCC